MNKYLLDSHTLLWYLGGSTELPMPAKRAISDPANQIFVSIGSVWEIALKHSLGKLELPRPFDELEPTLQAESFNILPI